jgi:beta-lactamase class A
MKTMNRRHCLALAGLAFAGPAAALTAAELSAALAALEQRSGGRLGVAVLASDTGAQVGHRTDERFGLCSTFKLLLAAAVLQRMDRAQLAADHWVAYSAADMVPHAPVTRPHLAAGGMPALALAEAAQVTSDNVAANLLLRLFGGPPGFTQWLRSEGDSITRIDRWEPEMNRVPPGDPRDTSTPAQICATARRLLTGAALGEDSTKQLIGWMEATRTGQRRLRAGLPRGWRAGDKTGTAMHSGMPDKLNDVAIVWPPGRAPWLVATYYEGPRRNSPTVRAQDEAVLAEVGRLVARWRG